MLCPLCFDPYSGPFVFLECLWEYYGKEQAEREKGGSLVVQIFSGDDKKGLLFTF